MKRPSPGSLEDRVRRTHLDQYGRTVTDFERQLGEDDVLYGDYGMRGVFQHKDTPPKVVHSLSWAELSKELEESDKRYDAIYKKAKEWLGGALLQAASRPATVPRCAACGKNAQYRCGGSCGGTSVYCGADCQRMDRVMHGMKGFCL